MRSTVLAHCPAAIASFAYSEANMIMQAKLSLRMQMLGLPCPISLQTFYKNLSLKITYLIIDALDECMIDLPRLLDFMIQKLSISPNVKWLVSRRN